MKSAEALWKTRIHEVLNELSTSRGVRPPEGGWDIPVEVPPKIELGDLAFPVFALAKTLRSAPASIAKELETLLAGRYGSQVRFVRADGPYVNLALQRAEVFQQTLVKVASDGDRFGMTDLYQGKRIMVEFSCPNTNKPLHLGHLRNNALGESVSRILKFNGAEVLKVNLINDRGIHICKSMLAYKKEGQGKTPEQAGKKTDHYVGDWYVRYAQMAQHDPQIEQEAQELLRQWEAGDTEVHSLWAQMNDWAISGIEQTYRRTGITFDKVYKESETYLEGKKYVLDGLTRGIFQRREDGAIIAILPWKENPQAPKNAEKVLLRADGTSIYLTQDIGTALKRYLDWPFDRMVYVVANEQDYHFKVLFEVLRQLGNTWADQLYHLSYGMVNLPEGRMKSREGTVVDADDLLDDLAAAALEEIRKKEREDELLDPAQTAEKIALGALNYFLLQVSPTKDMVFNPEESLNFNGNTGPYLQYTGARLISLGRKAKDLPEMEPAYDLLSTDQEWALLKEIDRFPSVVEVAALRYDPSEVANYLYNLARAYSRFYHDCPILGQEPALTAARLTLSRAVLQTLRNGLGLLNIPFLEAM